MRIFPFILTAWLVCAAGTQAQVTVEVLLDQEQYLPGEAITVAVRITNRSGQSLRLGQPDWLTFSVQRRDGLVMSQLAEVPVAGEFTLESSDRATKRVELTPSFQLTMTGRYQLTATVKIKQWNQELSSSLKYFDIITGTRLWEQEFGLPSPVGAPATPPEVRKYILQQAKYLKQLKLYVRVTDANESSLFGVYPIGPLTSFSQPETQVDKLSQLHVLFQTGARSFYYCVINPDGQLILRQTYDYLNTRPVLRADPEGKIIVAGGARRATATDLPAPLFSTATNDVKTPKP